MQPTFDANQRQCKWSETQNISAKMLFLVEDLSFLVEDLTFLVEEQAFHVEEQTSELPSRPFRTYLATFKNPPPTL